MEDDIDTETAGTSLTISEDTETDMHENAGTSLTISKDTEALEMNDKAETIGNLKPQWPVTFPLRTANLLPKIQVALGKGKLETNMEKHLIQHLYEIMSEYTL
jgi:hypothetical protein